MINRVQVAEARRDFANVVARSAQGLRIKITRYGRTLAGLVPKADLDKLEKLESEKRHPVSSGSR